MKKEIYSDIFDIVTEKIPDFRFSKESYLYLTECSPDEVNVLSLLECSDNRTFLETAYIAFLQRPVDEKAFENWKNSFNLPEDEFRDSVILTLSASQEFANTMISVKNNIYDHGNGVNNENPVAGSAVRWPEKLLRLYRKQPEFIKKAIRKSMGMKG